MHTGGISHLFTEPLKHGQGVQEVLLSNHVPRNPSLKTDSKRSQEDLSDLVATEHAQTES